MSRLDQQLPENPPSDQVEGKVMTKFCTLGLVTSRKWNSTKNYSKDNMKVIDFFCFYVEIDNGVFDVTRVLKIGCVEELQARAIASCLKYNIGPPAYDNYIPPSRS